MNKPEQQPKLTECRRCGYVACICQFKRDHRPDCQRRVACLDTKPRPCVPHGQFACAECHPCTCGHEDARA